MQLPTDPDQRCHQAPSNGYLSSSSSEPSVVEGSPCNSCASEHGLFGLQATLAGTKGLAARPIYRASSACSSSFTGGLCMVASSSSPAARRRQLSAPVAKRRLFVSRRGWGRPLSAADAASPNRPRGRDGRLMAAAQQQLQEARQSRPLQIPRLRLQQIQLVCSHWNQMLPSVLIPHGKLCKALEQHGPVVTCLLVFCKSCIINHSCWSLPQPAHIWLPTAALSITVRGWQAVRPCLQAVQNELEQPRHRPSTCRAPASSSTAVAAPAAGCGELPAGRAAKVGAASIWC